MQSPDNAPSVDESIQTLPLAASSLRPSKTRQPGFDNSPLSQSEASLPYRRSNPAAASLFASTLTPPGSRSISPVGRGSPAQVLSGSLFGSGPSRSILENAADSPGDPLNLILKSYVPHIAVYTSQDTQDLAKEKGFQDGLWELLRPFGERVQGKVTIRDSTGGSRTWEDFSVRFVKFGDNIEQPDASGIKSPQTPTTPNGLPGVSFSPRNNLANVEAVVDRHLTYAEESFLGMPQHAALIRQGLDVEVTSPYYALYLRRLLSGIPLSPHETFAHPVACVIAISSRSKTPIEELRNLYQETSQGEQRLPVWVDGEYLRYYVLIHDEERDDIARSMALFEQMKRHLGLHCHLLRLRSTPSAETDDDSIPLPRSDWMSAAEELASIEKSEVNEEFDDPTRYIFESDATAIRTFIREMVTQSIVPTMERHIAVWNEQVASRRRGITGRFMNLSRKWAGFGGGSRSSSGGSASGSSNNYDHQGFYRPDTPEAIMRKLADFAFMLRDWKLAQSTYDLLRSDFNDAKAWKYHAATNEMASLSLLILHPNAISKSRAETLDQMLEAAFYSYITRCSSPNGAVRCLTLGLELLRLRGGSSIDEAARWGIRLLDSKILGPVADALMRERLAICYASKEGVGSNSWGGRKRKSAVWSVLAAEAWMNQSKFIQAQRCLDEAERLYSMLPHEAGISKFTAASGFITDLQQHLNEKLNLDTGGNDMEEVEEEVEVLVDRDSEVLDRRRSRRASMMGRAGATLASLETAPLRDDVAASENESLENSAQDNFG
jgi:trafficking protein particle complex subunit 8